MIERLIPFLTDNSDLPLRRQNRFAPLLVIWIAPLLFLAACAQPVVDDGDHPTQSWADSVLTTMTLEQKVGQLLMIDLPAGSSLADPVERDEIRNRINRIQPGGVILFAADPVPTGLTVSWAANASEIAPFVALDAEWGVGYRLQGLSRLPDAMAIGATGNSAHAREAGRITAREAAAVGVNVLFAPTVDVNTNPANPVIGTRAYSDDADSVAAYARAFISGVDHEGLLAVMKHFPGHGGTSRDSHTTLPVAASSQSEFDAVHLRPYRRLIADSLAAIMTAHIIPEGHLFTDSKAATFSPRIVSDLLRDSLKYGGLVFTDALNMAGAASAGSPTERSIQALIAGVDVLLMPPDAQETKQGIIEAVRSGQLAESRINQSVRRILVTKERLGLHNASGAMDVEALFRALDSPTEPTLRFMARDAVTVLKDQTVLPLSTSESLALVSVDFRGRNRGPAGPASRLREQLEDRHGSSMNLVEVDPRTWTGQMRTIVRNAAKNDVVIVADYTGNTPVFGWDRVSFLRDIASQSANLIYISFDKPYAIPDVFEIPEVVIQSYDASDAMGQATADILFGLAEAKGRLPVHLNDDLPRGSGLRLPATFAAVGHAEDAGLDEHSLASLLPLLNQAVADSAFPTAAVAIGRDLVVAHQGLHGFHTFERDRAIDSQDVFDLASLTKVISTTTAIMMLVEDGLIDLDRPVADYLPDFGQAGKGMVTVRDLLSHTGGLIPFIPFHMQGVRRGAEVRRSILSDTLAYEPGSRSRYSDFGPITLAWMAEAVTGEPFDQFVTRRVFEPLGMSRTGYHSNRTRRQEDAVPTETDDYFRNRTLQGEVHDETAWLLGGTAGHAGLFSTVGDLTRFAGMLSRDGRVGESLLLRPETLRQFTEAVDKTGRHTRALGWDTKSMTGYSSAGNRFGPRSFGHTGFTGTSFWYDPDTHLYVILLTNRVHPTRENRKHIPIRPAVANIAFNALDQGLTQRPEVAE
jgi:beta-glucosidase-like glycosyl hydrolase/CubicO group peptidase (beta-lactamase class C family)